MSKYTARRDAKAGYVTVINNETGLLVSGLVNQTHFAGKRAANAQFVVVSEWERIDGLSGTVVVSLNSRMDTASREARRIDTPTAAGRSRAVIVPVTE